MEKHERDILRRNRFLLIKNIILTEEFYDLLRSYHVLPETMIRDVQVRFGSLFGNLRDCICWNGRTECRLILKYYIPASAK